MRTWFEVDGRRMSRLETLESGASVVVAFVPTAVDMLEHDDLKRIRVTPESLRDLVSERYALAVDGGGASLARDVEAGLADLETAIWNEDSAAILEWADSYVRLEPQCYRRTMTVEAARLHWSTEE